MIHPLAAQTFGHISTRFDKRTRSASPSSPLRLLGPWQQLGPGFRPVRRQLIAFRLLHCTKLRQGGHVLFSYRRALARQERRPLRALWDYGDRAI